MERRPEPELMDDHVQARAYADADFEQPHSLYVEQCQGFLRRQRMSPRSVLDLGCGPADITVRLARVLPDATIIAVEAAGAMLALACQRVAEEALADRIELVQGYLPDCLLPVADVDLLVSNSLLHHLADPGDLWRSIRRYGRPGAAVFVMDLMRPDDLKAARDLVDLYAEGEAAVLRDDFYHSLCAAYRPHEVEKQLQIAGLDGWLAVEVLSDRHLLVSGRLPGRV